MGTITQNKKLILYIICFTSWLLFSSFAGDYVPFETKNPASTVWQAANSGTLRAYMWGPLGYMRITVIEIGGESYTHTFAANDQLQWHDYHVKENKYYILHVRECDYGFNYDGSCIRDKSGEGFVPPQKTNSGFTCGMDPFCPVCVQPVYDTITDFGEPVSISSNSNGLMCWGDWGEKDFNDLGAAFSVRGELEKDQ